MKLPLSTLKSFIDIDLNAEKIEETISLLGIEVDSISSPRPQWSGVVVAEVQSTIPHPAASKLQVATVFDGAHKHQVVCGAPNCRAGLRVAFAKKGAHFVDDDGKQMHIEQTTIRGVESHGMLCSAKELSLYDDHTGILELPMDYPLGADGTDLLWDPIFEFSFTPNLGHCMSALGIARELSASLQKPLRHSKTKTEENAARKTGSLIHVAVEDTTACPRYTARLIEHVSIGPSPFWLQRQLRCAGIRPINNVVDATNYMLLKNGQPMHAFDFDKISANKITVSLAKQPQSFQGLDGNQWSVPSGAILISDDTQILALGGILGGVSSAVTDNTRSVLLEAAHFDSMTIRNTSKKMGLRTDSSYRFEKGTDPAAVKDFLDEAAQLIANLTGGKICQGAIDTNSTPPKQRQIRCRIARINQLLGTKLSEGEIESILKRLECSVQRHDPDVFLVSVPSYRNDVHEEIDLIEEVARIYGYNNIERPLPKATSPQIPHDPEYLFETELRRRLISLGLQEFLTCDLISPKLAQIARETAKSPISLLETLHSKSEEYSVLRPSLLPGLLQTARHNQDQKNLSFSAFELGRIHFLQDQKVVEFPMAAILATGLNRPQHWGVKPVPFDFFDLKGMIENLLEGLRICNFEFKPSAHSSFHPSRQADIFFNQLLIGTLGELHPTVLAGMDISEKLYYAELNAEHLRTHRGPPPHMTSLPQFPSSERDWTIALEPKSHIDTLLRSIHQKAPSILESVALIDLFQTPQKTNATFRFVYRDLSKTLSYEEVEAAHAHLIEKATP